MTETMIRERAARLQIELDSLCDEAGRMGFSIEMLQAADGRHRFAMYKVGLSKDPVTAPQGAMPA
jgi:hypothetical protein